MLQHLFNNDVCTSCNMLLFVFYKIKLRCDSALDHLSLDYYNRCFDLNAVTSNGAAAGSSLSE